MNVVIFVLLLALTCRLVLRTPVLDTIVDKFMPVFSYITITHDRLFRILTIVKDTFDKYGIPYAITGTTLLGAATMHNFIRKDKTIQLVVPSEYLQRIMDLQEELYRTMGIGVQDLPDGCLRI